MAVPTAAEVAFLEAIRAHPADDGPRLVYADWLEERGDSRGDFIRTHCQMQDAAGWFGYPGRPKDWNHLHPYIPAVEAWLGPAPERMAVTLERGLPAASMTWPRFFQADSPPPPLLAWLVRLDLAGRGAADPEGIPDDLMDRHPWRAALPPVRADLAGGRAGHPPLYSLTGLPWLAGLNLSGRQDVTDARLAVLAGRRELAELRLDRTAVTDAGLDHLTELAGLQALNLAGSAVTDAGLPRLAGLARLRRLDLSGTAVTAAGVARLRPALADCQLVCDPTIDVRFRRLHAWRGMELRW